MDVRRQIEAVQFERGVTGEAHAQVTAIPRLATSPDFEQEALAQGATIHEWPRPAQRSAS
jgi:hypothetical protein